MSLTKKVYLTISGYDIKLSDNLTFYQKDQLKLIFYINEYGIDYGNNAATRALMPVNPLNAILFIENPDGVDSVSSARIEDNAVTFYLDSTHTQYVGVSRMQLRLFDQDGCAITLPHFTFEIRENIYGSGDVRFQNVVMVDQTGTVILTEDNDLLDVGDILTMGTEVAYPQVTKTIKELPIKHGLDGTEKLIVEDNEATKQAPLGTIVDEIKQNSQEKIREIESELAQTNAQLSEIITDQINVVALGVDRNNASQGIAKLLADGYRNLFFDGEFIFNEKIDIPTGTVLQGVKEKSKLKFNGQGVFLNFLSGFCEVNHLIIDSLKGQNSATNDIAMAINTLDNSHRMIKIESSTISNFSQAGIILDKQWHITFDSLTIKNCGRETSRDFGGIVFSYSGEVISGWSGSGNILRDIYISGCSYALYNNCGWNVTLENCVFEYNDVPFFKSSAGTPMIIRQCWFENNKNRAYIQGKVIAIACRGFEYEVKDNNYCNVLSISSNNRIRIEKAGKVIFEVGEDGMIPTFNLKKVGMKTVVDADENAIKNNVIVPQVGIKGQIKSSRTASYSIESYTNYWGSSLDNENNLTGRLSLGATGSSAGSGMSYGDLMFEAGSNNGNNAQTKIRPVFCVKTNGTILPNEASDGADIGSKTENYNILYCNNIALKSPDGNFFKISVSNDGSLTTTKI